MFSPSYFPGWRWKESSLETQVWWGIELAKIAARPLEKQISHNQQQSKTVRITIVSEPKKDLRPQFSLLAAICRTNWTVKMRLITAEKDTFHVLHLQPQKQQLSSVSPSLSFSPSLSTCSWTYQNNYTWMAIYTIGFLNQPCLLKLWKHSYYSALKVRKGKKNAFLHSDMIIKYQSGDQWDLKVVQLSDKNICFF